METCCFCLGGDTDVPSFGTLKDAKDMISPCHQCSLVAHRKCLLEWFNTLPASKIKVIDVSSVHETNSGASPVTPALFHDMVARPSLGEDARIDINLNAESFTQWLFSIGRSVDLDTEMPDTDDIVIAPSRPASPTPHVHNGPSSRLATGKYLSNMVFLITDCPQCKHELIFTLSQSSFMNLHSSVKAIASKIVQYGGLTLGLTSAITGVVSMSYVGLTTCGLKIMESMLPGQMLVQFLTRKYTTSPSSYSNLSQLLLSKNDNYSIDNLEQALLKGLVDPLKFSRIPVLPIILYKMRSSSIMTTIFGNSTDNPSPINSWFTELMISGYISSLGNHELVRSLSNNFLETIRKPELGLNLFRGINLWKTNNMIAMLIPARWAYDVFFRLTFNVAYFNFMLKIRPREIANNMSGKHADKLEALNSDLGDLQASYLSTVQRINTKLEQLSSGYRLPLITSLYKLVKLKISLLKSLFKASYFLKYIFTKVKYTFLKFAATFKHDYSLAITSNSISTRMLTTVLWPFISSKVGAAIFNALLKNRLPGVPKDKVLFLSNMIGMVVIVFAKDIFNLFLTYHKGDQLSQLSVLSFDSLLDTAQQNIHETLDIAPVDIPGGFRG